MNILLRSFLTLLLCVAITPPAGAVGLSDVIKTLETPFQSRTDKAERIYDYQAEFFQESRIASLDRLQRARGRVVVAFDYKELGTVPTVRFRWEYEQPTTQEMVSDGKTLWVYLPENNQVIQSDIEMVNKARQNDPMTFLTGLGNLSRDFLITWAQPNQDIDGNYVLELTPRKVSSLINRMVIVVDRQAVDVYLHKDMETDASAPPVPPTPPSPGASPFPSSPRMSFPEFGEKGGVWFPFLSTTVYDPNGNSTIIEFSNTRVNFGVARNTFNVIKPAGVQVVRPTGQEMGF